MESEDVQLTRHKQSYALTNRSAMAAWSTQSGQLSDAGATGGSLNRGRSLQPNCSVKWVCDGQCSVESLSVYVFVYCTGFIRSYAEIPSGGTTPNL